MVKIDKWKQMRSASVSNFKVNPWVKISPVPEQPCWLYTLITLQRNSLLLRILMLINWKQVELKMLDFSEHARTGPTSLKPMIRTFVLENWTYTILHPPFRWWVEDLHFHSLLLQLGGCCHHRCSGRWRPWPCLVRWRWRSMGVHPH